MTMIDFLNVGYGSENISNSHLNSEFVSMTDMSENCSDENCETHKVCGHHCHLSHFLIVSKNVSFLKTVVGSLSIQNRNYILSKGYLNTLFRPPIV